MKEAEQMVINGKERISERAVEIEEIITKAREASAKAGAAVFTQEFLDESKANELSATKWLRITTACAAATVAVGGIMWYLSEPGLDQNQLLQRLSTKLVVLATLVSATIWCGRNYKAMKHLSTVNRHRATSIRTLQAFSAAASDVAAKDAVLLEATRAVFGNVPTGFIPDSGGDGDIKVVEVARSILPRQDSL